MSRFEGAWDEPGEMPAHFWQIDLQRALTSGRGQRILRDIEAALLAMPVHELIDEEIVSIEWDEDTDTKTGQRVCAVGAYAAYQQVKAGMSWQEALNDLADSWSGERDCFETEQLGRSVGLARTVAWELARINDEDFGGLPADVRHEAVLAWVRSKIKAEPTEVLS